MITSFVSLPQTDRTLAHSLPPMLAPERFERPGRAGGCRWLLRAPTTPSLGRGPSCSSWKEAMNISSCAGHHLEYERAMQSSRWSDSPPYCTVVLAAAYRSHLPGRGAGLLSKHLLHLLPQLLLDLRGESTTLAKLTFLGTVFQYIASTSFFQYNGGSAASTRMTRAVHPSEPVSAKAPAPCKHWLCRV
jgi:hypothetical protein